MQRFGRLTLSTCFKCGKGTIYPIKQYGMILCADCHGQHLPSMPTISYVPPIKKSHPIKTGYKIKIEELTHGDKI
jgi:hypothetical protein